MAYYIVENDEASGPYDMLALIRRRKNGSLLPTTLLRDESGQTKAAELFPELSELFREQELSIKPPRMSEHASYSLRDSARQGWEFIQRSHMAVLVTGMYLLSVTLISLLLGVLGFVGSALGFVAGVVIYGGYALCILRLNRGQRIEWPEILESTKASAVPLVLMGATLALPVGIGMLLLIAPGLLLLTLYLFAPLLIIEKKMGFWDAMEKSRTHIMGMGAHSFGVLFALTVANFFAGLCFVVPLLISLPLTTSVIADIYDKEFAEA